MASLVLSSLLLFPEPGAGVNLAPCHPPVVTCFNLADYPTMPEVLSGYISQYAITPAAATLVYRQDIGDIPRNLNGYDGAIAVQNCARIGQTAMLQIEDSEWLKVIVFDCAARGDTWMIDNNVLVEVDYWLAARTGILGRGGIEGRLIWQG